MIEATALVEASLGGSPPGWLDVLERRKATKPAAARSPIAAGAIHRARALGSRARVACVVVSPSPVAVTMDSPIVTEPPAASSSVLEGGALVGSAPSMEAPAGPVM